MIKLTNRDIEFFKSINYPIETSTINNSIETYISENRIKKLILNGYVKKEMFSNGEILFRLTEKATEVIKKRD